MHAAVTPPAIPIIVMPRGVVAILVFVGLAPSEADSRVQSEQAQVRNTMMMAATANLPCSTAKTYPVTHSPLPLAEQAMAGA